VSHNSRSLQAKLVKELIIVKNQVPQVIQGLNPIRIAGGGAGMLRRIDRMTLGQGIEERIPPETISAVKEN
jgi:hypothetical protein